MVLDTDQATVEILVSRLGWPVRLVRWRCAVALGQLLQSEEHGARTKSILLDWISSRQFEQEIVAGLSVLLVTPSKNRPDARQVRSVIKRPSLLGELLFRFSYPREQESDDWKTGHSGVAPASFTPGEFFLKYRKSHIPPLISLEVGKLERESRLPVAKQWAFEWQCLMDSTHAPHDGPPYYFANFGLARTGVTAQVSQRQCDVYRSAFHRTLACAVDQWGLPDERAADASLSCLPLNNGLAQMAPIHRPDCLSQTPGLQITEEDLQRFARKITRPGVLAPGRRPVSIRSLTSLNIAEFGVLKVSALLATRDFEPEADWSFDDFVGAGRWILKDQLTLEGALPNADLDHFATRGKSGAAAPFTIDVMPDPGGFWHNDIFACGLSLPASYALSGRGKVSCDTSAIVISVDDLVRASTATWLDHWTPLQPVGGPTRCGVLTDLADSEIHAALARQNRELAWIVELEVGQQGDSFDELKFERKRTFFVE